MKINLTGTLAVISALLMCVQNIPVQAGEIRSVVSEQAMSTDENLIKTGTCGENLRWKVSGDTLTISGTGKMQERLCVAYDYAQIEGIKNHY